MRFMELEVKCELIGAEILEFLAWILRSQDPPPAKSEEACNLTLPQALQTKLSDRAPKRRPRGNEKWSVAFFSFEKCFFASNSSCPARWLKNA